MHATDDRPPKLRVLVYSQDGFGLGHMRRTHLLAGRLLDVRATASVLTLSDSPLDNFFTSPPGHNYLKLPTIVKIAPGVWRPASPGLDLADVLSIRSERIWTAMTTFRPHLLLVDHMPHGAMGELLPALQHLKDQNASIPVVLGLRDILDAPDVVLERWAQDGAYQSMERYYDLVLVYGQREIYDLAEEYQLPLRVRESLHYCGYVCNPANPRDAARIRANYLAKAGLGAKMILALAGGGADGYPVMSTLLDALPTIATHHSTVAVLITGPFLPVNLWRRLQARARDLPVWVYPAINDTLNYIEAADLVVAMAGYNTTAEILRLAKPAILIPRSGPSAEQRMRAQLFAARGWVGIIDPAELSGERVAAMVIEALAREEQARPQDHINLLGLGTAVDHLLSLLAPV